jgi:hypothetical protein
MRPLQGRAGIGAANRGRRAQKTCPCPRLLYGTPSGFRTAPFHVDFHPRCPAEDMGNDQPLGEGVAREGAFISRSGSGEGVLTLHALADSLSLFRLALQLRSFSSFCQSVVFLVGIPRLRR